MLNVGANINSRSFFNQDINYSLSKHKGTVIHTSYYWYKIRSLSCDYWVISLRKSMVDILYLIVLVVLRAQVMSNVPVKKGQQCCLGDQPWYSLPSCSLQMKWIAQVLNADLLLTSSLKSMAKLAWLPHRIILRVSLSLSLPLVPVAMVISHASRGGQMRRNGGGWRWMW